MKRASKLLLPAVFLLLILLPFWWFVRSRTPYESGTDVMSDLNRLLSESFFKLGSTPVTPILILSLILFLVLITIASSVARRFVRRLLAKTGLDEGQRYAIEVGTGYLVLVIGILVFLQSVGLNLSSLAVVGGAIGVGIGFGLQNIFNNFVSGLILLVERPIKLGDRVQVQELLGDVVRIGARSTWVRTNDGIIIIVPNSDFVANSVTNWTASDWRVRISVSIGVGYQSDIRLVRTLLLQAAAANTDVLPDPAPDVILSEFGDSSINFCLRVWTQSKVREIFVLRTELYFAIHDAFGQHGIEIPFPQRDVHIRSTVTALLPDNAERNSPSAT